MLWIFLVYDSGMVCKIKRIKNFIFDIIIFIIFLKIEIKILNIDCFKMYINKE